MFDVSEDQSEEQILKASETELLCDQDSSEQALISCVTLRKTLNNSLPQFLHL